MVRAYQPNEPPSSALGKAIQYALNHREALARFLEHGAIPIDKGSGAAARARGTHPKDYLFAGSDAGGEPRAIAYTILACCRLADVNPVEYLRDVLPRLARRVRLRIYPTCCQPLGRPPVKPLLPGGQPGRRHSEPAQALPAEPHARTGAHVGPHPERTGGRTRQPRGGH